MSKANACLSYPCPMGCGCKTTEDAKTRDRVKWLVMRIAAYPNKQPDDVAFCSNACAVAFLQTNPLGLPA